MSNKLFVHAVDNNKHRQNTKMNEKPTAQVNIVLPHLSKVNLVKFRLLYIGVIDRENICYNSTIRECVTKVNLFAKLTIDILSFSICSSIFKTRALYKA